MWRSGWRVRLSGVTMASALVLGGWSCPSSREAGTTSDGADQGAREDMGPGTWWEHCHEGKIILNFCPETAMCNYSWMTKCDPKTSKGGVECVPMGRPCRDDEADLSGD